MFTFNNDKVEDQFYRDIIATKERIEVLPGKCRYNFKCHMNTAHEAMKHGHEKLAMVVYLNNGKIDPIIHFVNYHKGKFIDNTLGQWTNQHEYYLIKFITQKDFQYVDFIFSSYQKSIRNNLSWWLRFTSDIKF